MSEKKTTESKKNALKSFGSLHSSPQTVKDQLFNSDVFFDPCDQVQIKYEMLRRVRIDKQTVKHAAASFGFSRPSFYQAQEAFEKEGLPGLMKKKTGPRRAHKLNEDIMKFVVQELSQNEELKSLDLTALIEEKFGMTVHPRSVERALTRLKKKHPQKD